MLKRGTRGARVARPPGRTALLRPEADVCGASPGFRFQVSGLLSPAIIFPALLLAFSAPALRAQPLTPVAPPAVDSAAVAAADSGAAAGAPDTAKSVVARADTAKVVMHHFNHRQQIITGGSIMATLIAVMTVMNNYNPRVPPR